MTIPFFTYHSDDSDGYELLVTVDGATALVDGSMLHNDGPGDLMRAGTAIATGARSVDTWHGSAFHQHRLRFQIVSGADGQDVVRILAHEADANFQIREPALLDERAGSRLELAQAILTGVTPFLSVGDTLAHRSLIAAVSALREREAAGDMLDKPTA